MSKEQPFYAKSNLVFARQTIPLRDDLIAEVYGTDDAPDCEASGNSRAEHIAALLNEKPFPGTSPAPENPSAVDALAPFHEALSTSLHEAAGELHALTERVADILRTPLASEHIEDRIPADVYAMIDSACETADAARGAAEVLHDAIPPDYEIAMVRSGVSVAMLRELAAMVNAPDFGNDHTGAVNWLLDFVERPEMAVVLAGGEPSTREPRQAAPAVVD